MSEKIVLGLDLGSDPVGALAVSCLDGTEIASAVACHPRWPQGRYSDAAAAQEPMASRIEHVCQPQAVAHFEQVHQRHLGRSAQAGPLYVPDQGRS